MDKRRNKPEWQKRIAIERIEKLFEAAEREFKRNPENSHGYAVLARKIAMRYTVKIPKHLRRRICKKCHRYLVSGTNCMVRTNPNQKAVIVKCRECGNIMRFPYSKEKKAK